MPGDQTPPNLSTGELKGEFLFAVDSGDMEAVEEAIKDGVGVNARSSNGSTFLHRAALFGHREIVKWLIARGADVNACDKFGNTPLHCAARFGYTEIVEDLVTADSFATHIANDNKETPLDVALRYGHKAAAGVMQRVLNNEPLKAENCLVPDHN